MPSTLSSLATYQEDIKKSRFIALADKAESPAQALDFFAAHSVADATHNCWAYRIGDEYRFNDDGEPGGTAGRPILQAIDGQQCDRVAVLVVRWFGGVKLGPGGLIRAYGGVAAQCLRLAPKIELVDEVWVSCRCAFADIAMAQSRLAPQGARVVKESFDEKGAVWLLAMPRANQADMAAQFTNITRGQGQWLQVDEV
ncbi:YigZ family protein [Alcaligenaceae bacterium]|nr:YigZ family protein [Alcaligenaceae bacterium]